MTLMYLWSKIFRKIRGSAIRNSSIHKTSKVEAGSNVINSSFDRYSFCGYDCTIVNCDIGAFTSIADNVSIGDASHPIEWVSMSPVFYSGRDSISKKFSTHSLPRSKTRTSIGNDVWIGKNALIRAGVSIGDGSVVGMGSVVTKNIEPYTIVAGCPAKVIRMRFDDHTIQKLQNINWWNFTDEMLYEYARYFVNPIEFLEKREKDIEEQN